MPDQIKVTLNTKGLDNLLKTLGPNTKRFTISDGVEYGIFQEFSTSPGGNPQTNPRGRRGVTGRGHPSLVPALEKVGKDFPDATRQVIKNAVSSALATAGFNALLHKMAFDVQALWQADVNVDTGAYKNSIHVSEE